MMFFFQHGWEKNLDVMLMGATRGVFMALEKMGKSKGGQGGRIINVASAAGLTVCDCNPIQNVL